MREYVQSATGIGSDGTAVRGWGRFPPAPEFRSSTIRPPAGKPLTRLKFSLTTEE